MLGSGLLLFGSGLVGAWLSARTVDDLFEYLGLAVLGILTVGYWLLGAETGLHTKVVTAFTSRVGAASISCAALAVSTWTLIRLVRLLRDSAGLDTRAVIGVIAGAVLATCWVVPTKMGASAMIRQSIALLTVLPFVACFTIAYPRSGGYSQSVLAFALPVVGVMFAGIAAYVANWAIRQRSR